MSNVISLNEKLNSFPIMKKNLFREVSQLGGSPNRETDFLRIQGAFLKSARLWRNQSPEDIERTTGISPCNLDSYECGRKDLPLNLFWDLACHLGIQEDIQTFVALSENMANTNLKESRQKMAKVIFSYGLGDVFVRTSIYECAQSETPAVIPFSSRKR